MSTTTTPPRHTTSNLPGLRNATLDYFQHFTLKTDTLDDATAEAILEVVSAVVDGRVETSYDRARVINVVRLVITHYVAAHPEEFEVRHGADGGSTAVVTLGFRQAREGYCSGPLGAHWARRRR